MQFIDRQQQQGKYEIRQMPKFAEKVKVNGNLHLFIKENACSSFGDGSSINILIIFSSVYFENRIRYLFLNNWLDWQLFFHFST